MISEKGSITVEAAIVYPIVLLVLVTIIFFMIGLYRQVSILSVVNLSVEEAIEIAKTENASLYGGLTADEIKECLKNKGARDDSLLILGNYLDDADVRLDKNMFYKKINVSIYKTYPTGISFVDSMLGDEENGFTIYAESESIMRDPAEFIRNVDMISDFASRIPVVANLQGKYRNNLESINSKITDAFSTE